MIYKQIPLSSICNKCQNKHAGSNGRHGYNHGRAPSCDLWSNANICSVLLNIANVPNTTSSDKGGGGTRTTQYHVPAITLYPYRSTQKQVTYTTLAPVQQFPPTVVLNAFFKKQLNVKALTVKKTPGKVTVSVKDNIFDVFDEIKEGDILVLPKDNVHGWVHGTEETCTQLRTLFLSDLKSESRLLQLYNGSDITDRQPSMISLAAKPVFSPILNVTEGMLVLAHGWLNPKKKKLVGPKHDARLFNVTYNAIDIVYLDGTGCNPLSRRQFNTLRIPTLTKTQLLEKVNGDTAKTWIEQSKDVLIKVLHLLKTELGHPKVRVSGNKPVLVERIVSILDS